MIGVTGFDGKAKKGVTTTLGQGGSDTSVSALGFALHAEYIEIFTDVEGVKTADPLIVKAARHRQTVTYDAICNRPYQVSKDVKQPAVDTAIHEQALLRVGHQKAQCTAHSSED